MPIPIIGSVLEIGKTLIERLIPDPKQKAEALLKLQEMEQAGDLKVIEGQLEINKIEAANPKVFISGWRPFVGWTCGAGLAMEYVVGPLVTWITMLFGHPVLFPKLDVAILMPLLLGLLGMAGLRTYEKKNDVEGRRS